MSTKEQGTAATRKFTFGTSFDAPPVVKKPQPTFTNDDIEAARQAAYLEGESAGRQAAFSSIEQSMDYTLQALSARLVELFQHETARIEVMKAEAANIGHAIAYKLAPRLLENIPLEDISAMVSECVANNYNEPRIVVRVTDGLIDPMKQIAGQIAADHAFPGKIVIIGDDRLHGSDCLVEWADGGAERNEEKLLQNVDKIISNYIQSRHRAARDHMSMEQQNG